MLTDERVDYRKYTKLLRAMTREQRFWFKVEKTDDGDGCWLWTGFRNRGGYGLIGICEGGKTVASISASRQAWIFTHGPIPDGLQVCHHCDNPPCVRPDHLFLGTGKQNIQDAVSKGRMLGRTRTQPLGPKIPSGGMRGVLHHCARFTVDDIRTMRQRYDSGEASMCQLAREYGANVGHMSRILRRLYWKSVA